MKNKASSRSLIEKAFKLSLSNIWRNKFLSLATIFVIGTTIFIFNVIFAVNIIAKDALNDLNRKIDIVVYLKESTSFSQSQDITEQLLEIEGVNNVTYKSKEDALNQIKSTHPDISIAFDKYKLGNPLPASLNITTSHPKYHSSVAEFLNRDQFKALLTGVITDDSSTNSSILTSVSENLLKVTDFANQLIFWLIMIFLIGGALIILNAIQITIFSRKKEVNVMKLVGAPYWFIRLPFIIESVLYGIFAVIISIIMLNVLSDNINLFQVELYILYIVELIVTILLSIFSALLAVHEYLRKNLLED